jgi:uncharacterized protein YcbK (DUF882 family)
VTARIRRIPAVAARLAGPALLALALGACSMTSDPDTLFGLSPNSLSAASGETPEAAEQVESAEVETAVPAEAAFAPSPTTTIASAAAEATQPADPIPTTETETVAEPAAAEDAAPAPVRPAEKRSFLAGLFASDDAPSQTPQAPRASRPLVPAPAAEAKPLVALAAVAPTEAAPERRRIYDDALPGVRNLDSLFEINRSDGLSTDADIDVYESGGSYQVASLAPGLARLAPNGLRTQTASVDVKCLQPALVRTLKSLESHFGKPVIVTSGYRSPEHNRRVRGARASYHMRCAAADVQVVGVDKHRVASYLRALPGRGGVGTYCSHASVHVDVGPRRDWNWRCRS